jgi:large subunit ribosomal protein L31
MKAKIHPKWYSEAKITCACGNEFTAGSTQPKIHVEICSACHPFFTGQMRYIDVQGRVEKFQTKQKVAQAHGYIKKKQRKLLKLKKEKEEEKRQPKSFKEMLSKK